MCIILQLLGAIIFSSTLPKFPWALALTFWQFWLKFSRRFFRCKFKWPNSYQTVNGWLKVRSALDSFTLKSLSKANFNFKTSNLIFWYILFSCRSFSWTSKCELKIFAIHPFSQFLLLHFQFHFPYFMWSVVHFLPPQLHISLTNFTDEHLILVNQETNVYHLQNKERNLEKKL